MFSFAVPESLVFLALLRRINFVNYHLRHEDVCHELYHQGLAGTIQTNRDINVRLDIQLSLSVTRVTLWNQYKEASTVVQKRISKKVYLICILKKSL